MKLKISATLSSKDGEILWEEKLSGGPPESTIASAESLENFGELESIRADACMYCGSTKQLSSEHIVPVALGGTVQVLRGSCEECRNKTQRFEGIVLRGELRNARYVQGIASRTKHRDIPKTVTITLLKNGAQEDVEIDLDKAPILLPLPMYSEAPLSNQPLEEPLIVAGVSTLSFGPDPESLASSMGATGLVIAPAKSRWVEFAQLLAKIAYGYAFFCGITEDIEDRNRLVAAFLDNPETLGGFVRTKPGANVVYPDVLHRLEVIQFDDGLVVAEVQLFANAGAPTYLVALGHASRRFRLEPHA